MPITRTTWTDDDGTGTTGTIVNNAEKTLLYNQIDATCAFVNQANTFTGIQAITDPTLPQVQFNESGQPVDARRFRLVGNSQLLLVQTLTDAGVAIASPLIVNRAGDVKANRDLYEKSRATAMGHWDLWGFSPGNFWGASAVWDVYDAETYYTHIGRTYTLTRQINSSHLWAATYDLNMHLSAQGFLPLGYSIGVAQIQSTAGNEMAYVLALKGQNVMILRRWNNTQWPVGAITGTLTLTMGY